MSTKLTPSQIKKIIKEELENILLEVGSKTVEDAIDFFKIWARKTGAANSVNALEALKMLSKKTDLTAGDLTDARRVLNKITNADPRKEPLEAIYKELSDRTGLGKAADDAAPVVPISTSGGSNLGLKAAAAGAVAAGGGLMSMDPEEIVKDSDATQLQSLPPEKLASFPEDELSNLPPEKQEIVKQKLESAKVRRTRIAHLAIAAKNAKDSVIKLQSRLGALGYSLGKYGVDGDYGPATVKAVKDFQWANDLVEDGIVGKNTWKVLSGQGAQGPGKTGKGAGAGDGEGLGAGLLSSLRSMDKNDEKLKYVYNATRVALTRALEEQGVPNRAAFNTAQGYLPPVTPNPYGNTMDVVKEKRILAISNLLKKGIKVRLGDKDIVVSPKAIYDSLKAAIARGEALKEGVAHSLVFNNQTRLLD